MTDSLIIGFGYLGKRVGNLWLEKGRNVHVLTRCDTKAKQYSADGFFPIVGDVTEPSSIDTLPDVQSLIIAVGHDRHSGKSPTETYVNGLQTVLKAIPVQSSLKHLTYISSTGVYSQGSGEWISESCEANPTRESGIAILEAESMLSASRFAKQTTILRLAGIYGPHRIPQREKILAGEAIKCVPDSFLNLVHVDDAARAVVKVDDGVISGQVKFDGPEVFLICDDTPAPRETFYRQVAKSLNAPEPTFEVPPSDELKRLRAGTSKRVSNRRFKETFRFAYQYPDISAGMKQIIDSESG